MDRPIDEDFRKQLLTRRVLQGGIALLVIICVFVFVPGWIAPSVSRNRIRTATVDRGPVEATISATGTVLPEFEQVISSPIDTRILKILKTAGSPLKKGDPIVNLDLTESQLALEKVIEELALKQNRQQQLRLELDKTLNDLQSQLRIKRLRREFLQSNSEQQQRLVGIGASSKEQLRQAKLEEEIAAIELEQLENSIENTESSLQAQLDGLALETKILQNEKAQLQRQLDLAGTKAERDGVLSWVVADEGATVRKGDPVARVADLRSFRVEATVSDVHASRLAVGLPAKVKINDELLPGTVTAIHPTIQNGIITLILGLEDKSNALLRSNLRVDAFVITARNDNALRLKKGPLVSSEGAQQVFVLKDGVATRTPVQVGILSFEFCEVMNGLQEGDVVIISDMKDYAHMSEVQVK